MFYREGEFSCFVFSSEKIKCVMVGWVDWVKSSSIHKSLQKAIHNPPDLIILSSSLFTRLGTR